MEQGICQMSRHHIYLYADKETGFLFTIAKVNKNISKPFFYALFINKVTPNSRIIWMIK